MAATIGVGALERRRFAVGTVVGRAGIDHRHLIARADDIGLGAGKGIVRGIGREHAPNQWFAQFAKAGRPGFGGNVHSLRIWWLGRPLSSRGPAVMQGRIHIDNRPEVGSGQDRAVVQHWSANNFTHFGAP